MTREEISEKVGEAFMEEFDWWYAGNHLAQANEDGSVEYGETDAGKFFEWRDTGGIRERLHYLFG